MVANRGYTKKSITFIQVVADALNKADEYQALFGDVAYRIAELCEFEGCVDC